MVSNFDSSGPLTRRQRKELERAGFQSPPVLPDETVSQPPSNAIEPRRSPAKRPLAFGTIIAISLLFVGVSLPVNIFYGEADLNLSALGSQEDSDLFNTSQTFTVAGSESSQVGIQRQSWSVTSYADVLKARYGSRSFTYSTTGTGPIRWPFPTAVPISSGYGDRIAPCRYCSSNHRGVDFVPGSGAPIFAIADGIVTAAEYGGGYGQYVYLEHQINGRSHLSVYAHMRYNSSPVKVGDQVRVGDFLGLVGSTGISTGPHLHFELRIDGEYVDPFAWLKANAF